MNRRMFCLTPLVALPALAVAAPSAPDYAVGPDWRYVGPYCDMGCFDMHLYIQRNERAYAFLTYHWYDGDQNYRGPYPAFEWDYEEDMDWLRQFYPSAFHER